ncbi:MAG: DUF5662 family protein [Lachnospiraceae bacterium]
MATKNIPPITAKKAWSHFRTITKHKVYVARECFSVGLYRQGLLHDLSKYSPTEFLVGARYYQGTQSPNNKEREVTGVSTAWLHHKGRNLHHYEYWLDYSTRTDGGINGSGIIPCKMPGRYVVEMFLDRVAASKVYRGAAYTDADPWKYYTTGNTRRFLYPETADLLEKLLLMLRDEGEEKTYAYIRAHLYQKPLFPRDKKKKGKR